MDAPNLPCGYLLRDLDLPDIGPRSYLWPTDDQCLWKWSHQVSHIDRALPFVKSRGVCVQAGGACGTWPLRLSRLFDVVYTFEPFIKNFKALAYNTTDAPNVVVFNAALGNKRGLVKMDWANDGYRINFGAQFVTSGGNVPTMRLDDLALQACDLLILDVEGSEGEALLGGAETIRRCKPVIMFEEAGHVKNLGWTSSRVAGLLSDLGYNRRAAQERDDVVMIPDER